MSAFLIVAIIFFGLAAISPFAFKTAPSYLWSIFVAIGLLFLALSFAGDGIALDLD